VKPRKKQMKPHVHAELIKAWADGSEIEVAYGVGWRGILEPRWLDHVDYRIKPTPTPDIEKYLQVSSEGDTCVTHSKHWRWDNLKLTFDGETGKLKSSEVL
jgi:hypothetical protein